jgi:hypothetical protein
VNAHTIAVAIAVAEGFYVKDSIPQRCSNPGDLELGNLCDLGTIDGKTIFPNATIGWQYLERQVEKMLSGRDLLYPATMTLAEVGLKYSGGDPAWSKNVAETLSVPETITLAELALA